MIQTGSKDLDSFMNYPCELTTIYGPPASGKTTLATLALIHQALSNKKVVYIDTENSFSIERAKQLSPKIKNFLKNIILLQPKNFEQQNNFIQNLPKNISLVIVDTIGYFYRINIKQDSYKTNKLLDMQLRKLTELTRNNTPVIVTNQVYSTMDGNINIVSGNMLKNWTKFLIRLEKEPKRKIIIEKPKQKEILFEIKEKGIFKV